MKVFLSFYRSFIFLSLVLFTFLYPHTESNFYRIVHSFTEGVLIYLFINYCIVMSEIYVVYILRSGKYSYIGMTNDFLRRWRQHNKMLKGGARYTSKRDEWTPICIIDGFKTKIEAMQCEWKLKRVKGYKKRVRNVYIHLTQRTKWTSKSPIIKSQGLKVYVSQEFFSYFNGYPIRELYWF